MKREKLLSLVAEAVQADRDHLNKTPITMKTLSICFSKKTVNIDGRVIDMSGEGQPDCIDIPILQTDRPIVSRKEWYG